MKITGNIFKLIALSSFIFVSFFMASCGGEAKFQIRQVYNLEPDQYKTVVVVPMSPIRNMYYKDLLDGEKKVSDYIIQFFKKTKTRVVTAEQVRRDMNIQPDQFMSDGMITTIASRYGADCLFNTVFPGMTNVTWTVYNTSGSAVSSGGYVEGAMIFQLTDANGKVLAHITGCYHYNDFWTVSPRFKTYVKYVLYKLKPKLNVILDEIATKKNKT